MTPAEHARQETERIGVAPRVRQRGTAVPPDSSASAGVNAEILDACCGGRHWWWDKNKIAREALAGPDVPMLAMTVVPSDQYEREKLRADGLHQALGAFDEKWYPLLASRAIGERELGHGESADRWEELCRDFRLLALAGPGSEQSSLTESGSAGLPDTPADSPKKDVDDEWMNASGFWGRSDRLNPADSPEKCPKGETHARIAHPGGRCIKCGGSPSGFLCRCTVCAREERTGDNPLENGWPKCCGYTMRLEDNEAFMDAIDRQVDEIFAPVNAARKAAS